MTDSLIARLEAAEVGSRELDALITAHFVGAELRPYPPATDFGPSAKWQFWSADGKHFLGNESKFPVPPVTTSLDAALALAERVLPGWYVGVQANRYELLIAPEDWSAYLSAPKGHQFTDEVEASAPTPALALCIAILKAKEASQ